ncbi:hypothetical protein FC093_11770 [Ilyomonas limi]|uniref:DUF4488 domain-containing protein n=1 Tax=Ilyomonas limi TaxID=2575867 RepID=A0A4U3L037_9BACT|nr:hypothetical protein [Ilyomonas limi]TKK68305.1 hypothetical protein FC093_11770 [Ilyomonas limi]
MKYKLLFAACLLFTSFVHAQNITGIWKGYFLTGLGMFREKYNYEVQINQLPSKALRGVTYSYHTTTFYGKALLKGVYNGSTKNIIFKEDTLVEMRAGFGTSPCLFTCYLDYHKIGTTESLEGTFTSVRVSDGGDCGGGTVYLERVQESDFHKEDFLTKKQPATRPAAPPTRSLVQKAKPPVITRKPPLLKKDTSQLSIQQPITKPPVTEDTVPRRVPVPPALTKRENSLVRKITTDSPDIKIDLYDNGEIDGDTITVYHNNEVVAYKKLLGTEPVTIHVKATAKNSLHEFIMYADNLGKIPPNTALMVITTGGQRYELSISSSLQKNAKVVIQYQP